MRSNRILVSMATGAIVFSSFAGVAAAQDAKCETESPNTCVIVVPDSDTEIPDTQVKGQVVTKAPAEVAATQQDGLGGAQGALALTGGDAMGLSVIGAGLLGAGALAVAGSRRKAKADS